MLDVMRKHASSWFIKLILGAIIITFIFFFGYSSFRKGMRGGRVGAQGNVVAKVNGIPVSESEFEFFFANTFERIKQAFEDKEIPEFAKKLAENQTIQQLIGREIMLQQADAMGIVIPDDELANAIRDAQSAQATQAGGEFDPIAYRHEFLPYFRNRYGMDYEQFVRQDLRLGAFGDIFRNVDKAPESGDDDRGQTWTFEVVTFDPKALLDAKAISAESEAAELARTLAAADSKSWAGILKPLKVTPTKVGPISIAERGQILGGTATLEDYQAIFTLTKAHPVTAAPIAVGNSLAIVRLIDRQEKPAQEAPPAAPGFLEEWIGKLLAKAKVHNYLQENQKQ